MRKFLYWLTGKLPARYIDHVDSDGAAQPYLERYQLATLFGKRLYIHRFVASDPDGLHDHPFLHAFSIILAGWYWEHSWTGKAKRWLFNTVGPNDFHRVELPGDADVWTLFTHTPRVKPWGFLRPTRQGAHGSVFEYMPQSDPADPQMSDWAKTAPKGNELREKVRKIPLGMNWRAYQKQQRN